MDSITWLLLVAVTEHEYVDIIGGLLSFPMDMHLEREYWVEWSSIMKF